MGTVPYLLLPSCSCSAANLLPTNLNLLSALRIRSTTGATSLTAL